MIRNKFWIPNSRRSLIEKNKSNVNWTWKVVGPPPSLSRNEYPCCGHSPDGLQPSQSTCCPQKSKTALPALHTDLIVLTILWIPMWPLEVCALYTRGYPTVHLPIALCACFWTGKLQNVCGLQQQPS